MLTLNQGSLQFPPGAPPHLSGVICMRPCSPLPPVTLGLQVDSCMANDMRTVAGMPCAFSAAWNAQSRGLQGANTAESAACWPERILIWSRPSFGGFQPPEVRPQLRKFCDPLGCWSLAPLEPQLFVLKPKRPEPEAADDDDDDDDELDLESLLPEEDDCELALEWLLALELDLESELDWLEAPASA